MKPGCKLRGLLLALSLVGASGCGSTLVDLGEGERDFKPADYQAVFERWSRELQILPVDGIENVLTARATHLSWEFRWAYVVKEAHDLRLSPAERQANNEREAARLAEGHEFFISVMSGIGDADHLDPEEGPWKIRLVDDRGRQVEPIVVEELRDPTAAEIQYFSLDPVHRRGCRVIFPLVASDGRPILSSATRFYTLRFSSAYGQGEVKWEIASN